MRAVINRTIALIGFLVALNSSGYAQQYSIQETHTVDGLYTFTVVDNYPPENYNFHTNGVNWSFGDATTGTGSTQTVTHQYTQAGTYNVNVNLAGPELNTKAVLTITVVLPQACPKVMFTGIANDCGEGLVTISAGVCEPGSYWELQEVNWNMGDGSPMVTTNELSVQHTYSVTGAYMVQATAVFISPSGDTCHTDILNITHPLGETQWDLNTICGVTNTFTTLGVHVSVFSGYLTLSPSTTPVVAGQPYDVILNYTGSIFPTPLTTTLSLNGSVINTQSNLSVLPVSGSVVGTLTFEEGGQVMLEYLIAPLRECNFSLPLILEVLPPEPPCEDCFTFKPEVGKRYWVSGWVRESSVNTMTYANSRIEIDFTGSTAPSVSFTTTGDIIEGWQRIVGDFIIPVGTTDLNIRLVNTNAVQTNFFDDIRIHPFNASMKSYVYDPVTFLLTAELDDNNYATFYEYDNEGQLIRIKKETARGVMTIQESRSSNPKN